MKICVVSNQVKKTISGIGLHTKNLINVLVRDGHQVYVIAPHDQRPDGDLPYTFLGVKKPLFSNSQARWLTLSWNFGRALHRLLHNTSLDLVHFTDARESFFYRGRAPAVGNINDTYSAELFSPAYYRQHYADWIARWCYYRFVHITEGMALRRLSCVIANSRFTARTVHKQYDVRPEKLTVCYKSIDPEIYRPAQQRRSTLPPHPPRILFVGSNMQRKGLPLLIRAAPAVASAMKDVEFWVVGEDKVVPRMKEMCREYGVLDHFRFMGWKSQEELIDIYAQCDVFAMPSLTEAFGVVFLEAMAAGAVVVGTNVGGIPEIIEDGINGKIVAKEDPGALGDTLLGLLTNVSLMDQLRAAGYRRVNQFKVDQMMRCTYQIYASVLNHSAGCPGP